MHVCLDCLLPMAEHGRNGECPVQPWMVKKK